jgi:hypothetical protein
VSSELHKPYYDMIVDGLNNGGSIKDNYKLDCAKHNKHDIYSRDLFTMEKNVIAY